MLSAIKRFLNIFFNVRRIRCERNLLTFGLYDLVSFIPNPTIKDVYIVTRMDPTCVYVMRWVWYSFETAYKTNEDNELCIEPEMVRQLYLVKSACVNRSSFLYHMSPEEMARFVSMLNGVYGTTYPLGGIFISNDAHVMLITETEGPIDTGHMTVQDLSASPMWGIFNYNPIQHYCRQRDIVYSRVTRGITYVELITALRGIAHPTVQADLCKRLINAINMSLSRVLYYEPVAGSVTAMLDNKTHSQPNRGGKEPPDKEKQGVKVK